MRINVTQLDIQRGLPRLARKCPIARAIRRATGYHLKVSVTTGRIIRGRRKSDLPRLAQDFIRNFDQDRPVTPIAFELEGGA